MLDSTFLYTPITFVDYNKCIYHSIYFYFQGGRRSTLDLKLLHYSAANKDVLHVGDWHDEGQGLEVFDPKTLVTENNTEIETLVVVSSDFTNFLWRSSL